MDEIAVEGIKQYVAEVKSKEFPDDDHTFTMKEEELNKSLWRKKYENYNNHYKNYNK